MGITGIHVVSSFCVIGTLILGCYGITDKMCRNQVVSTVQGCSRELDILVMRKHGELACSDVQSHILECVHKFQDSAPECFCSAKTFLDEQSEVIKFKNQYSKCEVMVSKLLQCSACYSALISPTLTVVLSILLLVKQFYMY
ncbi:Uncharacterised protein g314 [Pycnogonum litorale]